MKKIIAFLLSAMMLASLLVIVAPADEVNLALNKTVTVVTGDEGAKHHTRNASINDGVKADSAGNLDQFYAFYRYEDDWWDEETNTKGQWGPAAEDIAPNTENIDRDVKVNGTDYVTAGEAVIDLGAASDITKVVFEYTNFANSATNYIVYTSADGETWTEVKNIEGIATEGTDTNAVITTETVDVNANAQYVKIGCYGGAWMFLGEVEVYGEGTAAEAPSTPDDATSDDAADDATSAPAEESEKEPATPSQPGDASNMIVFAVIALVAIAGSAVVIKSRG